MQQRLRRSLLGEHPDSALGPKRMDLTTERATCRRWKSRLQGQGQDPYPETELADEATQALRWCGRQHPSPHLHHRRHRRQSCWSYSHRRFLCPCRLMQGRPQRLGLARARRGELTRPRRTTLQNLGLTRRVNHQTCAQQRFQRKQMQKKH